MIATPQYPALFLNFSGGTKPTCLVSCERGFAAIFFKNKKNGTVAGRDCNPKPADPKFYPTTDGPNPIPKI